MAEKNTYGLPQGTRIRVELRAIFAEQRRAALRWLRTGETKGDLGRADRVHGRLGVRLVDGRHDLPQDRESKAGPGDPVPGDLPDWDEFGLGAREIADRIVPLLRAIWDDTLKDFVPKVGLDPNEWSVTNPEIGRAIDEAALAFAESTNATTTLAIDEAIARTREAIRAGNTGATLSYDDLTRVINEVFSTATASRARTIAVTESARAVHQAQELAGAKSGTVTGWKWLLSSDACPLCQTIARRAPFVRLGQPFAVIGDNAAYSQIKFPPAHPRCQCSMVEVIDIDDQPEFSETLIQPVPEEVDIATQDLIPVVAPRRRKSVPLPRVKFKFRAPA